MTRKSRLIWLFALASVFAFSFVLAEEMDPYGKPKDFDGPGYKVWKAGDGWHLRMKTEKKKRIFSGVIRCMGNGRIIHAWYVDAGGKRDHGSWNEREIRFTNTVAGDHDGIEFETDCGRLEFDLLMDGNRSLKHVYVGANGLHPYEIPFRIRN
jgi:hypothetical protein